MVESHPLPQTWRGAGGVHKLDVTDSEPFDREVFARLNKDERTQFHLSNKKSRRCRRKSTTEDNTMSKEKPKTETTAATKALPSSSGYAVIARTSPERAYLVEMILEQQQSVLYSKTLPIAFCFTKDGLCDGWLDRLDRAINYISFKDFILHNIEHIRADENTN